MTIKIYLKQKGESLETVILEDVRTVVNDGEFYRFVKYGAAPDTVYNRKNVVYWRYVKPGAPTAEEGSEENGKD